MKEALAEALGGSDPATKPNLRDLKQRSPFKFGGMLIVAVGIIFGAQRHPPALHS
jgi:hypothetical protein